MPSVHALMFDGHVTPHVPALHAAVPVDHNGPASVLPASSALASPTVHAVAHVPQWSMLVFKSVHTPASAPAQ